MSAPRLSEIIDFEKAFLREFKAIISNHAKLDEAILSRQSIKGEGKTKRYISLSEYRQNPTGYQIEQTRALTKQTYNLSIMDIQSKLTLEERAVLDAAIWEARNRVVMQEQNKYLKATYGNEVNIQNFAVKISTEELEKCQQHMMELDKAISQSGRNILRFVYDFHLSTDPKTQQSRADNATMNIISKIENRYTVREQAVNRTLETILNQTKSFEAAYNDLIKNRKFGLQKHLGIFSHDKAINDIRVGIYSITNNNKLSSEQKLERITEFLETQYENKFNSKKYTPQQFVNKMNNEKDDHHVTRFIGLFLKECYAASADPSMRTKYNLTQLELPDKSAYQKLFAENRTSGVKDETSSKVEVPTEKTTIRNTRM